MEDNGWRLAGLEFAYPPDDVTEQSLATTKSLRSEDSVTPEEEAGKAGTSSAYSKDMYAFGALAAVILGERNLDDPAASRFLASTIEGRLLSSEPADRPPIATLLRDEYVQLCLLSSLHTKTTHSTSRGQILHSERTSAHNNVPGSDDPQVPKREGTICTYPAS